MDIWNCCFACTCTEPDKLSGNREEHTHTHTHASKKREESSLYCSYQLNFLSWPVTIDISVWFISFQIKSCSVKGWRQWTERADLTQFAVFREQNIISWLFLPSKPISLLTGPPRKRNLSAWMLGDHHLCFKPFGEADGWSQARRDSLLQKVCSTRPCHNPALKTNSSFLHTQQILAKILCQRFIAILIKAFKASKFKGYSPSVWVNFNCFWRSMVEKWRWDNLSGGD